LIEQFNCWLQLIWRDWLRHTTPNFRHWTAPYITNTLNTKATPRWWRKDYNTRKRSRSIWGRCRAH